MSWSNVIRRFALAAEVEPIGSDEFIREMQRARRAAAAGGERLDRLVNGQAEEKRQAYLQGVAAGEKRGLERGRAEANQVRAGLQKVLVELAAYRETLHNDAGSHLLQLAFAIADDVIGARVEREEMLVMATIDRCISAILDASKISIRVSPAQHRLVSENLDLIKQKHESVKQISVEADTRVAAGGCVVETDSGSVDGRISSQLALLRRELAKIDS